jgi:transposase
VIGTIRAAVPAGLDELATLGRTLQRRRGDVLAYFTHRASNGPTEASTADSKPYAATHSASAS